MGVVYKSRDTHLDRFVAIKLPPAERVAKPTWSWLCEDCILDGMTSCFDPNYTECYTNFQDLFTWDCDCGGVG